jgi:ribonuclease BN (tRNA processing enzyme)
VTQELIGLREVVRRAAVGWLGLLALLPCIAVGDCGTEGVWLQVLGSGGPEADDGRASTGYLIQSDGRARVLVDLGAGTMANFERAGARIEDLDAILVSHFHVDHSADLPALMKASWFTRRDRDLALFGPTGNLRMPGAQSFVDRLLGPEGAYSYLSGYLDGSEAYRLVVKEVPADGVEQHVFTLPGGFKATAVPVHHGPNPALAWRVEIAGRSVVVSGDLSGRNDSLPGLASAADLLVIHNAVPEGAEPAALNLHVPPSAIGQIAAESLVRQLVLSHRMNRSLGREEETLKLIREHYAGPVSFAEDLACFAAAPASATGSR